jgi:hypothetical protein
VITAMRPAVTSVAIFSAARIESATAGSIAMGVIQKANTIAEYSSPGAPPALLSIHCTRAEHLVDPQLDDGRPDGQGRYIGALTVRFTRARVNSEVEARPLKSPVRTLSDVLRRLQPTVVAAE